MSQEFLPDIFWREFSFLRTLEEDLFPNVYEFYSDKSTCFYVMDFIEGKDLRAIIAGQNNKRPAFYFKILFDVLKALKKMNDTRWNFYHGDLKPENILIDSNSRTKLIDPAARYSYESTVGMTLTVPYNPLGLRNDEADTFAIAVMVIEVLLHHNPFADLKTPLLENGYRGLPSAQYEIEKKKGIEDFLMLKALRTKLPGSSGQKLIDWLLTPRKYDEMIKEWSAIT